MTDHFRCQNCDCRDELVEARDNRVTHPYFHQCYKAALCESKALRKQLEQLREHVAFSSVEQQQLWQLVRNAMTRAVEIHRHEIATEDNVKHQDAYAHTVVRQMGELLGLSPQAVCDAPSRACAAAIARVRGTQSQSV